MADNAVEWVPEDSTAADRYLKQARRESFKTFSAGHLTAPPPPKNGAPRVSSLVARFFQAVTLQTPTLPADLLPPRAFIDNTIRRFTALRDNLTEMRLVVEESAAGVRGHEGTAARMPSRPAALPSTDRMPAWYRFVDEAMTDGVPTPPSSIVEPTSPLSMAMLVHLDAVQTNSLLAVLCRRLHRAQKGDQAAASDDCDGEMLPKRRLRKELDSDDNDERAENAAGDEGSGSDADASTTQQHAANVSDAPRLIDDSVLFDADVPLSSSDKASLRFLRLLMVGGAYACAGGPPYNPDAQRSLRCGYGYWLYVTLACLHTPIDPATGRLLHQTFAACCTHLRSIAASQTLGSTMRTVLEELRREPVSAESCSAVGASAPRDFGSRGAITPASVAALQSLVVVLGKYFGQANPDLVPL